MNSDIFASIAKLFAEQLTIMDFFVAFIIVALDEYVIKKGILKGNVKYKAIYTFAPLVLAMLGYTLYALITKSLWYSGLLHGALVGLTSMGSYDVILRVGSTGAKGSVEDIGKAIKEEVEK